MSPSFMDFAAGFYQCFLFVSLPFEYFKLLNFTQFAFPCSKCFGYCYWVALPYHFASDGVSLDLVGYVSSPVLEDVSKVFGI